MSTAPDESDASVKPDASSGRRLAALAEMSPVYFGMVMATGIVSLAAHMLAIDAVARALFQLNVVVYAALWVLTALRVVRHPRRFFNSSAT